MDSIRLAFSATTTALLIRATTPASAQQTFTGIARNIDGDSLHVGSTEVRLFGIDAPEYHQTCTRAGQRWSCGADAADWLARLVNGNKVTCEAVDTDEHGRTVARCSVGGLDINRTLVASGYAVAYRHYSNDYVSAEQSAKVNRRGLWSGTFEMPMDYRHEREPEPETVAQRRERGRPRVVTTSRAQARTSGGCVIKGNRGLHGWIYHVPGMPYYAQTRAEQMFCSEADARAAGYRRARVR